MILACSAEVGIPLCWPIPFDLQRRVCCLTEERTGKSPVSFVVFRRQLPSPEHSRGSRGSGEAIEALGKLQDRFPRAGIGQLPSHLPRLLGAVEPLPGFIQNGRHFGPPSIVSPACPLSYSGHVSPSDPSSPKAVISHITRA